MLFGEKSFKQKLGVRGQVESPNDEGWMKKISMFEILYWEIRFTLGLNAAKNKIRITSKKIFQTNRKKAIKIDNF